MRTAICSGSFDPITLGHLDVITRAARCFDRVVVCVSANTEKAHQMFTPEEKLRLVQTAISELPNVEAELWPGLLIDFARKHGACAIVRGARNGTDFDAEYSMTFINKSICPEIESIIFPASPEVQFISSTMARDMIRYDQPLEKYLPPRMIPVLREMRKEGKNHGE